jgi:hypothetical protein
VVNVEHSDARTESTFMNVKEFGKRSINMVPVARITTVLW